MNNKQKIVIALVLVLIGAGIWYKSRPAPASGALDGFAACLAEKKAAMYGAAWCSHCQNQKKLFGDSFRLVPYVECPENTKLCLDKGVEGYPTWILGDGTKLVGEQKLTGLAAATSCPLPPGYTP